MFSLWNNFHVTDKLSLGFGMTYQDSFFVREDNNVEVPDFTRVDAAAFYQVNDRVRLQLNIENLFDEEYFAADLGDLDAEFLVGEAEDHELAWYGPSELPFLVELG